jgi:putative tricarboxylic transport membrane protein
VVKRAQAAVALGVALVGLGVLFGATQIGGSAGYTGVGPGFLPFVVGAAVLGCGAFLLWEAASGGFRAMDSGDGEAAPAAHWAGFAWVSAGLLLNAALIERIGFILSCVVCFVLATQGIRRAQGIRDGGVRSWLLTALVGFAIAAPVYWMFTKFLAINLPGLTQSGWL